MKMKKVSLFLFSLLLVGCSNITVLDHKSETGKDQDYLIWFSLALMSIVILVVFILFTWSIIRSQYTKESQNVISKDVKGNLKLELTYTILPILLLIVLAVATIKVTMHQSPSTEAAQEKGTQIDVTAKQ